MTDTSLNINAIYGEIAREVATIGDVDILVKIRNYVSDLIRSSIIDASEDSCKNEVLDDFRSACHEYKLYSTGKKELHTFDDVLNSI